MTAKSTSTDSNAPSLYLIDGHAQMFRAFFAIRSEMTSPVTGEPTNALFAFTGMLLKLYQQFSPSHVAMVIDGPGKTFRDELYEDYKANRDAPPDEFVQQLPRMIELAELFGIPVIPSEGVEADDIMATLAHRCTQGDFDQALPGLSVRLVAKDKDLEQVLSDRVQLWDLQTDSYLDVPKLKDKRGITPEQVIDYQALIGDSVDNVPGVKGIGPKTASKLLDQFGSLDEIIANVDQLKGKQQENVRNAIDSGQLELSRQLVTLKIDVPIELDFDACETLGHDKLQGDKLQTLFRELGFNRHVKDLQQLLGMNASPEPADAKPKVSKKKAAAAQDDAPVGLFAAASSDDEVSELTAPPAVQGQYETITTLEGLQALAKQLRNAKVFAFDTETLGLGGDTGLVGMSFAWASEQGVYVPVLSPDTAEHLDEKAVLEVLGPILEDPKIGKVGHNLKYDLLVMRHAGVEVLGSCFDTMIAAFLSGSPGLGMDQLALSELAYTTIPITDLIGHKPSRKSDPPQKRMDEVALPLIGPYAAEDADITWRLYELFKPRLTELGVESLAQDVEMPLVEVLADMQWHGIRVEPEVLNEQRKTIEGRVTELRRSVLDGAGVDFNPDSPKQLAEVLFDHLNFKVIKKTKTGRSTDAEVLEKLADLDPEELAKVPEAAWGIPAMLSEYRMLTKLVGTYFQNLIDARAGDGRIHSSLHQTGAATGRLSSSNPNLQNIPIRTDVGREVRRAFVAEPGHVLIAADYSQVELRMLAHLSEDPALMQAFVDGQDIHRAVAAEVYDVSPDEVTDGQRASAKMINFGIIYGITPYGLARRVDSLSNEQAAELIENYKKRFAGIDRFLQQCVDQAQDQGYVTTILGRRRAIPEVHSTNRQRQALGERLAINTVVQGSAADLIKAAMVNLHRRLGNESSGLGGVKMLLQIHDELIIEAPQELTEQASEALQQEMVSAMSLHVPLVVDVGTGTSWYETK